MQRVETDTVHPSLPSTGLSFFTGGTGVGTGVGIGEGDGEGVGVGNFGGGFGTGFLGSSGGFTGSGFLLSPRITLRKKGLVTAKQLGDRSSWP